MSISPLSKRVWPAKFLPSSARITSALAFAIGGLLAPSAAGALTLEQARGACIESVGRPNVQACMQNMRAAEEIAKPILQSAALALSQRFVLA